MGTATVTGITVTTMGMIGMAITVMAVTTWDDQRPQVGLWRDHGDDDDWDDRGPQVGLP